MLTLTLKQALWPTGLARLRALGLAAACSVAGVALVWGVWSAVQDTANQRLGVESERAAAAWAGQLATTVPDIHLALAGDPPSPTAQDRLHALRAAQGLLRLRLYDLHGSLQWVSDSAAKPGPSAPQLQDNDAASAALARQAALGLRVPALLRRNNPPPGPTATAQNFVPLRQGSTTVGVMEVVSDQSDMAAAAAHAGRMAGLATALAIALAVALAACAVAALVRHRTGHARSALDRAAFLTEHDVLTGALNHRDFSRRVEQACRHAATGAGRHTGLAVICIDLDGFCDINIRHGHQVGDELLRRTGERLQSVLRGADLLARLAGDRFAVLQHGTADSTSVSALVQRIVQCLAQPHDLPGAGGLGGVSDAVVVSAGVGAALHGVDGDDADTLLHHAELALLRAKASGRGAWSFYDASLDRRLQERRALANDLRQAIAQGWLRLHFQPLYRAAGGALIGYEALARWTHPTRGAVPPMEFIPVAEETGQIQALGRWVLDAACAEAATWPAPLSVAVNLSAAQFRTGPDSQAIVAEVRAALQRSGLAPQRLELEITESLLMNHTDQVLSTLHALHALGARIAMDDFGTGYSSLAYLWRFPFDKLKIDRAFTQGLGSDPRVAVIVRSIVTMAHSLSIRVNAEGVETAEQRDALCLHGCDELQGYLLGRPVPTDRLVHREAEVAAAAAAAANAMATVTTTAARLTSTTTPACS